MEFKKQYLVQSIKLNLFIRKFINNIFPVFCKQYSKITMDFFKRIGTLKHKFKLEFFLSELTSNATLKGQIYVVIKRGEHKVTSIQKCSMDQSKKCDFKKQILSFDSLTLFYDQSDKKYQQKPGQIRVILINKKDEKKLLGVINFDAGDYANQKKQNLRFQQKLQDCPQKVKMTLSFQVFIKYIGEASQTSKSKSTVPEVKKSSSLSKISNFVESIFNSPQPQVKNDKSDKNKMKTYKQQKKQKDKESQDQFQQQQVKPKKGKMTRQQNLDIRENKNKNTFKSPGYQSDTYNYNLNSQASIQSDQKQKKKKQEQQAELTKKLLRNNQNNLKSNKQDSTQGNKNSKNKTVPVVNKNKTLTDLEQSEAQKVSPDSSGNKAQNIIYFDQVYEQENKNALKKKTDVFGRKYEDTSSTNQTKQQSQQLKKMQSVIQENEKLKQQNSKLKSQIQTLKSQCNKLKDNQAKLNQKIEKLQAIHEQIQDKHEKRQRETIVLSKRQQQLQQRVRALEKEKGEYLVNVQKMKNYVKQLQIKNEQLGREQEDRKLIFSQQSRAEVKRLKDQISNHRYKIQKINAQKDELAKANKNLKKQNQETHQGYERVQKQLTTLKLRICDELNQANQDGDRSVVEILANLS